MSARNPPLAVHQRDMLALIKGRGLPADRCDPHVEVVRNSQGLAMLRMIAGWWRRRHIEHVAALTSRALDQAGRLEEAMAWLNSDPDTPAAIDALGMRFLERYAQDPDPLIAALASTERALTLVSRGDRSRHEIPWDRSPAPVLNAVLAGREPPSEVVHGDHMVVVSCELPDLIAVL